MNLNEEQEKRLKEAVGLLTSGYHPGALSDIAEVISEANDRCCGCSWPDRVADILEGK